MSIRAVFLDFDGVLNSHDYLARIREEGKTIGGLMGLDRLAVARLNRLIREADDAKVVISSSWRHGRTRPQLARLLADAGFVGSVIGMTPDFVHVHEEAGVVIGKQRGDEIQAWLDVAPRFGHDVDSFVILDDGSDMAHLKDRLVKTEFSMGLLEEHVDRAIRMLCAAPPLVVLAEAIP